MINIDTEDKRDSVKVNHMMTDEIIMHGVLMLRNNLLFIDFIEVAVITYQAPVVTHRVFLQAANGVGAETDNLLLVLNEYRGLSWR